jgi:ribosomal protein S4
MAENINFPESRNLGRLIKNNYSNIAQLKELMSSPPMSAAQHAAIMKKRTEHRRMIEEARELKLATNNGYLVR